MPTTRTDSIHAGPATVPMSLKLSVPDAIQQSGRETQKQHHLRDPARPGHLLRKPSGHRASVCESRQYMWS